MTRVLSFLLVLFISVTAAAQADSSRSAAQAPSEPPYKRYPGLPPIDLLLSDSSTVYTTEQVPEKPLLLIIFDPGCHHCQATAQELYQERKLLTGVQVIMATMAPLPAMRAFRSEYKLDSVPQVLVGADRYFLLPPFFNVKHLPFMALYDRRQQLLQTVEGSLAIPKAVALLTGKKD